jgi:hypothetical protein
MITLPGHYPIHPRHRAGSLRRLMEGLSKLAVLGLGGLGGGSKPCCCGGGGCTCSTTICVESCSGSALVGATVTVGSLAPVTTGATGCVSICLDSLGGAGSYQVKVSDSGYIPYSNTLSLTCNGTKTTKLLPTGSPSILFQVYGCCSQVLPGATVTIAGATYTTDSSGQASIGLTDAGAYPWSISKSRFDTTTGSTTIGACPGTTDVTETLTAASGYECAPTNCAATITLADPIPDTLTLTDSVYGAVTLTYLSTAPAGFPATIGGGIGWYSPGAGTSVTALAACSCPSGGVTVWYFLGRSCFSCVEYPTGVIAVAYGDVNASRCPHVTGSIVQAIATPQTDSLSPTIPYDYSVGMPAVTCGSPSACSGITGGTGTCFYPGGVTLTVTE